MFDQNRIRKKSIKPVLSILVPLVLLQNLKLLFKPSNINPNHKFITFYLKSTKNTLILCLSDNKGTYLCLTNSITLNLINSSDQLIFLSYIVKTPHHFCIIYQNFTLKMIAVKQLSSNSNPLFWLILSIKLLFMAPALTWLVFYHQVFSKLLFIDIVKRYLTCVTNLICIRVILIALGFFRFENNSFKFFNRSYIDKFTLRSGYIGVANHSNIIDFLFYNYIMSPTFVRILIINYANGNREFMYIPLTFREALGCAMTASGFQPIVVTDKELNKIKMRKLTMPLLVVETFQNLKGPILVMLPGIRPQQFIQVDSKLVDVLHSNEAKFSRWTVGFCSSTPSITHIYKNQVDLVMDLLESFSFNVLKVEVCQFHRTINYEQNFQAVIARFMTSNQESKVREISYEAYIEQYHQRQDQAVLAESQNQKKIVENPDSELKQQKLE